MHILMKMRFSKRALPPQGVEMLFYPREYSFNYVSFTVGTPKNVNHFFGEKVVDSTFKLGLESWYEKTLSVGSSDTEHQQNA